MKISPPHADFSIIEAGAAADPTAFAREVRAGLTATRKHLHCKYFYDERGSRLFEAITELPEYYLTRAGMEILERHAREIVELVPEGATLVELGSGSSTKTRCLIEAFLARRPTLRYVPVDISKSMLEESACALLEDHSGLRITAIAAEYADGLRRLSEEADGAKLILWLGSNVGNLHPPEAATFLRRVRAEMLGTDRLLMGVDLRKSREALEAAYDDSQGVTARFNLNLLARINRELGGEFDLERFSHRAAWNETEGRIEIHIVSRARQRVRIDALDLEISFEEGETIHTENSYKYSLEGIRELASAAGMTVERQWLDSRRLFSKNLLSPVTA